ncbi:MAG: hypothetical protein KA538_12845 [Azonexus sp.]|jgi:hypothetical protein|nr:hypothetical protein [Azonexus sp.]
MADPLKIIRRLDVVTTDYAVFERDQVLTHDQLNSVAEYLDDQQRLSRTQLLGVGIVGGLKPSLGKEQISVGAGVGVTTDGDLLGLRADRVFTSFLAYDESAPAYEPFYVDGKMVPLLELLPADANDKREGKPLAELGDRLKDLVLLAFMESYENDPDLCTGGDCDNHGRTARNTQRMLLVERNIAEKLGGDLLTGERIAARLPRVVAARAKLGNTKKGTPSVTSAEIFVERYLAACKSTFGQLAAAIEALQKTVGKNWPDDLPSPANWLAALGDIDKKTSAAKVGVQYYHAFLKDLAATWDDLRETLFADTGVLCPSADAFPKHLLLGAMADPAQLRTGHYPSPWLVGGNAVRERLAFLLGKIAAMIEHFAIPATPQPRIVPSRRETAPLELRAVPCYYAPGRDNAIRLQWNEQRRRRNEATDNFGYHWTPAPGGNGDDPFERDQGSHDFYRIEGHLGMKVEDAEAAIETLVRQRNLPIAVMSVVLHNERKFVLRGPKFKKTSLHSLHYLLRQDLASQLKDNVAFSQLMVDDVTAAAPIIKRDKALNLNVDPVKTVEAAQKALTTLHGDLLGSDSKPGPLAVRSYKAYGSQPKNWDVQLDQVVLTATKAKSSLGEVLRSDLVSPVDSLSVSKSHLWVKWLGDILDKRDDDKKDRLLFGTLVDEHPGLEHAGGCVPGGTFVLAYNDAGVVIGDLTLPYWIDDVDESEHEEPALTLPDIHVRIPKDLLPIKVIRPFDLRLEDFKFDKVLPEINLQKDYQKFFQESLGGLGDVLKNTKAMSAVTGADIATGAREATNDKYMRAVLGKVKYEQQQMQDLKEAQADETLPAAVREKAGQQAKAMEAQLADTVGEATRYFAVDAGESVRFEADKTAVYATLGGAAAQISDTKVSGKLQEKVAATVEAAKISGGGSALVGDQLMSNAFRFK